MKIVTSEKTLKVLFVGSEMWPYASVGGLSRVMSYLPQSLLNLDVDARVFIPKYGKINTNIYKLTLVVKDLQVPINAKGKTLQCNIYKHQMPEGSIVYFIENKEYFELRANEYGYADDPIRWGILQKGLLEFLKVYDKWTPDIIHCNEWQTGLISNYLHSEYKDDEKLKNIKTLFTIHSLAYQAGYDHRYLQPQQVDKGETEIPDLLSKKFLKLNSMRRGIMYSDAITIVSPTYAREILTKEYGEKLEHVLTSNENKITGILNGIDYTDYDPNTDPLLFKNFREGEWIKRSENKLQLQEKMKLKKDLTIPLFIISYRLSEQKGLDLIMDILPTLLKEFDFQLIVNGDGDAKYKEFFSKTAEEFPDRIAINLTYNDKLPRLLFAGGDFLLHPSKFEPCGIVQLEAMRYGCIPIVRRVGGLADTVIEGLNGFSFDDYNSTSLLITIARAFEVYKHAELFNKIKSNCMKQDFSWDTSAEKYLRLYKKMI